LAFWFIVGIPVYHWYDFFLLFSFLYHRIQQLSKKKKKKKIKTNSIFNREAYLKLFYEQVRNAISSSDGDKKFDRAESSQVHETIDMMTQTA